MRCFCRVRSISATARSCVASGLHSSVPCAAASRAGTMHASALDTYLYSSQRVPSICHASRVHSRVGTLHAWSSVVVDRCDKHLRWSLRALRSIPLYPNKSGLSPRQARSLRQPARPKSRGTLSKFIRVHRRRQPRLSSAQPASGRSSNNKTGPTPSGFKIRKDPDSSRFGGGRMAVASGPASSACVRVQHRVRRRTHAV